jgi:glycine/D-amino acid oxidase-like deaminating enzyme
VKVLPREKTDSGWFATLQDVPPARELSGEVSCDWLVVGGGWMGLHAARRLAELRPDDSIALIDAGRIGNGAAGRCAGFAIDLAHNPRKKNFVEDLEGNRQEAQINREGIAYMRDAVERFAIDCDWSAEGKIHGAASPRGEECLRTFALALDRIGEPYEWYDAAAMQAVVGTDYYSRGLFAPGTVLLQPAAYLRGLAESLGQNVTVYEDSPVTEVLYGAPVHVCRTPRGGIRAKRLILANNGFLTYFGFYGGRAIPVYTYGSLTRPLTAQEQARIGGRATFGVIPADPFGTTMRRTTDNRLFIRNVYAYASGFQSKVETLERAKARHRRSFDARYPAISKMGFVHSWGGALCLAQNGGMVFGEVADRVFAVAFCNGTGVARGAAFGKAIAELAAGGSSPAIEILRERAAPSRAFPRFVTELGVRVTTSYRLLRAGREA